VAAAFKISLMVRNAKGQVKPYSMTASDVNGEYWLFQSGGSELSLSSLPCVIDDCILTAAGTDCSQTELFVNGVSTGIRIYHAANLGTVYDRQLKSAKIVIPANAQVKFKQLT